MTGHEPFPWVILASLTIVGAILRVIGIDEGLWLDEIKTLLDSVRLPFLQILTVYPSNNQHQLYSVLAHLSIMVFGEHPWSLRLPALLFGVATIPLVYLVGALFTTRTEALLASALLTFSYHHIWFSQNARGYTALAFWTLLATYLLFRMLTDRNLRYIVSYAVVSALGIYTHLTMVFVVISHAVLIGGLMMSPAMRKNIQWRWLVMGFTLAGMLALIVYAPLILDIQHWFMETYRSSPVTNKIWAMLELLRELEVGFGTSSVLLGLGVLLLLGFWSYIRQSPYVAGLFVAPGILFMAVAWLLRHAVFPRFFFFLIGFGLLILTRGAMVLGEMLSRRLGHANLFSGRASRLGVTIVILMVAASAYSLKGLYLLPKQDFEQAAQYVNDHAQPSEIVAAVGLAGFTYLDYYQETWERVNTLEELEALRLRGRRVWVIYTLLDRIKGTIPDVLHALEKEFSPVAVFPGTLNEGEIIVGVAEPLNVRSQ